VIPINDNTKKMIRSWFCCAPDEYTSGGAECCVWCGQPGWWFVSDKYSSDIDFIE